MENNDDRNPGLFSDFKGWIWKLAAGLVSFALLVPLIVYYAGDILGLPPKLSLSLILIIYFLSPLLAFLGSLAINVRDKERRKFLSKRALRPHYLYISVLSAVGALTALAGILVLAMPYQKLIVKIFYFFCGYFLLVILFYTGMIFHLFRKKWKIVRPDKKENGDAVIDAIRALRKKYRWLVTEYAIITGFVLITGTLYFTHSYSRSGSFMNAFPSKEQYELGFYARELNRNHIKKLEQITAGKNNELIRSYSLSSLGKVNLRQDTAYLRFDSLHAGFKKLLGILIHGDTVKITDSATINSLMEQISGQVKSLPTTTCSSSDLQQFDHMMNMPKATLQLTNSMYAGNWTDMLTAVQRNGLMILFLTLVFLLTVWLHLGLVSLQEEYTVALIPAAPADRGEEEDSPDKKKTDPLQKDIRMVKTIIPVILLLIIPIFKPITRENIQLDKTLWQVSRPELNRNEKPTTIEFPPLRFPDSMALREYDRRYIKSLITESTRTTDSVVQKSREKLFRELKGK